MQVPEFKGFFQRLAAVAALCLQDTSAGDLLAEISCAVLRRPSVRQEMVRQEATVDLSARVGQGPPDYVPFSIHMLPKALLMEIMSVRSVGLARQLVDKAR